MMEDFARCVIIKNMPDGYKISCKLGLWSVEAPTRNRAESEARHYFRQYRDDGEYYSIIGGTSPVEVFINSIKSAKVE